MKIVKEGEECQIICADCGLTHATYLLRDVDFSDKSGTVKGILAAVCDQCHQVVGIPAQSTAKVKAEYRKVKKPIDIRVPAHYLDILNLATMKIDGSLSDSFSKALILYYLHALSTERYPQQNLKKLLAMDIGNAKASKRLSMKVNEKSVAEIVSLMKKQGLKNNTEVFKSVILRINEDIVQAKTPDNLPELQNFAAAFA
ncbi:MAG: hypothetical protein ACI8WB_003188 [Phenylobacterium sp.]|jgi:hypothetical protein